MDFLIFDSFKKFLGFSKNNVLLVSYFMLVCTCTKFRDHNICGLEDRLSWLFLLHSLKMALNSKPKERQPLITEK